MKYNFVVNSTKAFVSEKDKIPTVIERYDITDDWAKEQVPVRNDKENKE